MTSTSWIARAALFLADAVLVGLCLALAYHLRFRYGVLELVASEPPPTSDYVRAYVAALFVFTIVLSTRGLYQKVGPRHFDVVERTWGGVTLAAVVLLAGSFFVRELSYSRAVGVLTWAGALLTLPLPRLFLLRWRRYRYARGLDLRPVLVIGQSPRARLIASRLRSLRREGVEVRGTLSTTPAPEPEPAEGQPAPDPDPDHAPSLGSLADLESALSTTKAREVLVAEELVPEVFYETLERCERLGVEVRLLPQVLDLFVTEEDLGELRGLPYISVREHRLRGPSAFVKRAFDLVVGAALLVLAAPLILVLTLWIRLDGEGPGLFGQSRVGQDGRVFRIWKLRSMIGDAERRLSELVDLDELPEPVWKDPADPRVTPLGRWLRRLSLDELPQLYNVVRGDMSLVGPRPEVEAMAQRYDAHQRRRLKAKPGLTGLQQVTARGSLDLEERVALDVYYTRRRTFLFDLWILARTPLAVLRGRGAW
ncbi:MAG: sugar transferase [Planctomycetes bacterium]|nr:sugar transferase [Planctomycetota bacterium]